MPANWGFLRIGYLSLYSQLNNLGAKLPIVSNHIGNIPVFWRPEPETGAISTA
jgi:hypothetical protein